MGMARIVRQATTPDDLLDAAPGTVIVSADGRALVRTRHDDCGGIEPYWFDVCHGCMQWELLGDHEQDAVFYATDQLFADGEDPKVISRAMCIDGADLAAFHHHHQRRPLQSPFVIAYTPTTTGGAVA